MITSLKQGEVIVVGTNKQGKHGAGAAAQAHRDFGLKWGIGEGLSGQTYALPTMEGKESFQQAINTFIAFAKNHPHLTFLMTPVGTGIAGYSISEVQAMLPVDLPSNVIRPEDWN